MKKLLILSFILLTFFIGSVEQSFAYRKQVSSSIGKVPLQEYALTVTGTSFTLTKAIGIPYQTLNGSWRFRFNLRGTVSGSPTVLVLSIEGIIFNSFASLFFQALTVGTSSTSASKANTSVSGDGDFTITSSSAFANAFVSGDVALDGKPDFVE